jgi:cob(I)alamin adenosyltransferase
MVKLNRITTRTGDGGTSGLASGERRSKADLRFAAIGDVDETNATIGVARLAAAGTDLDALLARLQNDLFDLGADLATPQGAAVKWQPVRIAPEQVARLEAEVAALNADLPPLTSFVLPGGTALAAHLHVARAVARRAERSAVALAAAEPDGLSADVVRYLNRLSDLLFVAARYANRRLGDGDVLWKPGATR